jgi:hypothetical protein
LKFKRFFSRFFSLKGWTVSALREAPCRRTTEPETHLVYTLGKLDDILNWCYENGKHVGNVDEFEGPEIWEFLELVWQTMEERLLTY